IRPMIQASHNRRHVARYRIAHGSSDQGMSACSPSQRKAPCSAAKSREELRCNESQQQDWLQIAAIRYRPPAPPSAFAAYCYTQATPVPDDRKATCEIRPLTTVGKCLV